MKVKKPNIIYIYGDDLGRGLLSCYGQTHYRTPNIDRLAACGMMFHNCYGTALCAPARASLLCGIHDARQGRWSYNKGGQMLLVDDGKFRFEEICEIINNNSMHSREDGVYLSSLMKQGGYYTAEIGKLEWGFTTTPQEMADHGWDYHYGYYDHDRCHGYYPPYLFENGARVDIPGNTHSDCGRGEYVYKEQPPARKDMTGKKVYSQDLFDEKILSLIERQKDREQPLFLYHPSQLPHGPVFYPEVDPQVINDPELTQVEKEYASMVLRLDKTVGKILDALDRTDQADNTVVIFSSDNGHAVCYMQEGRTDTKVTIDGIPIDNIDIAARSDNIVDAFDGNNGMAGLKSTNWDGGAKIPFIVRFPSVTRAGSHCNELVATYDVMATMAELCGIPLPAGKDGVSFLPALRGEPMPPEREYIVYGSPIGPAIVMRDGWKLRVVLNRQKMFDYIEFDTDAALMKGAYTFRLYYLPDDYSERKDLSREHPEQLRRLTRLLMRETTGNLANGLTQVHYRLPAYDW